MAVGLDMIVSGWDRISIREQIRCTLLVKVESNWRL